MTGRFFVGPAFPPTRGEAIHPHAGARGQRFRDVGDRAIDSHIWNLRRKLERAGAGEAGIASVHGVGYRLEVDSS